MDPNNPLRGPRRAARRGEEALRYDRGGSQPPVTSATAAPAPTTTAATPTPATGTPTPASRPTATTEIPHSADAEPDVQWRYNEDTEEIEAYEQRADGRWAPQADPNTPGFFLGGPEEATWGSDEDDNGEYNDGRDDFSWGNQINQQGPGYDEHDPFARPPPVTAEWEAAMDREPQLREWDNRVGEEIRAEQRREERREDRLMRLEDPDWPYSGSDVDEVDAEREERERREREEAEEEERQQEASGEEEEEDQQRGGGEGAHSRLADDPRYRAYLYGNGHGEGADEGEEEEDDEDDERHNIDEDDEMQGPEDDIDVDADIEADVDVDGEIDVDDDEEDAAISFDPMLLGLKEINNLAHFSVSSHKPGNGVEELLHDDLAKYWQSDGPQPHLLTIHFLRRVEIRAIRFYVDYNQDESYTPTSVVLSAGTGHHDLLEFASLALTTPVGWQEIDLSSVGGGADGQSLCCWIVQVKVKENHQNGKDTHIRGIKLYAIDENAPPADGALDELARIKTRTLQLQTRMSKEAVAADKDDYLFERLIAQSPDKLPGAPERSGSMAKFLRDEEIR
ncbi:hypothetical protein SBRCBS47491_002134 [Sporothrix bragantina]|uniref:DOC domain-containing protein n=1 Tax=Sporothrix bragantina TaxID=671064 RepID=A0ABP0B479_9PEZI